MLEEFAVDGSTLLTSDASMQSDVSNKADEALLVKFYKHAKLNKVKTEGRLEEKNHFGIVTVTRVEPAGRPVYDMVEYISIKSPGDKFNVVERPATDYDRRRFPRHYAAFRARQGNEVIGTPLEKWPLVDAAQIEELKFWNIRTVEQLAATADGSLQNVGHYSRLKQMAVDYLDTAKGLAPAVAMRAELEALRAKVAALESKPEAAFVPPTESPKKRGRPRKTPEAAQE